MAFDPYNGDTILGIARDTPPMLPGKAPATFVRHVLLNVI